MWIPSGCFGTHQSLRGVQSSLAQMRTLQPHELVHLFHCYMVLPFTRRMASNVFKVYCHIIFSTRIELHFLPMVCIGGQLKAKESTDPQWHSSHTEFKGSEQSMVLEVLRARVLACRASVCMNPSHVLDYSPGEITSGLHI